MLGLPGEYERSFLLPQTGKGAVWNLLLDNPWFNRVLSGKGYFLSTVLRTVSLAIGLVQKKRILLTLKNKKTGTIRSLISVVVAFDLVSQKLLQCKIPRFADFQFSSLFGE